MFKRRYKGRKLVKIISYIYLLLFVGFIFAVFYMFDLNQISYSKLFTINILTIIVNSLLFLIMYISPKKVKKDSNLSIICIIIGFISFLWYFNWLGLILLSLLLVAAYDLKKS